MAEPIDFEVCVRSGQLPWECGLAACDNGCTTETAYYVPASLLASLEGELRAAFAPIGGLPLNAEGKWEYGDLERIVIAVAAITHSIRDTLEGESE